MKQNLKFLYLMAQLDKEEVSRFGKHLHLEYAREGNALQVYQYYHRFFPGKEQPKKMAIAYAYEQIYGHAMGPELNDPKKIWNAFSKLYGWLKDFLILKKLRSDPYTSDVLWLKVLAEKGLNSEYAKQAIASYQSEYTPFFNREACQQQIELGWHYKHQFFQDQPKPDYKAIEPLLIRIKERADLISLQFECEWMTIKGVRPSNVLAQSEKACLPVLHQIYQHIFHMLSNNEEEHYLAIETLLNANIARISPADINDIYRYLQFYAAQMLRKGDEQVWGLKMHGLNKALLGKEAYLSHREMASTHFQNIVNTACTVSDFEWVNKFVEEYAPFLPAKIRAENVSLAQAAIAFEGKDFRKVIALTEKPQFKDEIHLLRMRVYQLRAMYELDLDCTNVFNTYYTYLVRHRKPVAKYKESAIAFMGVFNMLTQKKVTRKTLIEAIETNPQIFARKWLKDKAHTYRSTVYRGKET